MVGAIRGELRRHRAASKLAWREAWTEKNFGIRNTADEMARISRTDKLSPEDMTSRNTRIVNTTSPSPLKWLGGVLLWWSSPNKCVSRVSETLTSYI